MHGRGGKRKKNKKQENKVAGRRNNSPGRHKHAHNPCGHQHSEAHPCLVVVNLSLVSKSVLAVERSKHIGLVLRQDFSASVRHLWRVPFPRHIVADALHQLCSVYLGLATILTACLHTVFFFFCFVRLSDATTPKSAHGWSSVTRSTMHKVEARNKLTWLARDIVSWKNSSTTAMHDWQKSFGAMVTRSAATHKHGLHHQAPPRQMNARKNERTNERTLGNRRSRKQAKTNNQHLHDMKLSGSPQQARMWSHHGTSSRTAESTSRSEHIVSSCIVTTVVRSL